MKDYQITIYYKKPSSNQEQCEQPSESKQLENLRHKAQELHEKVSPLPVEESRPHKQGEYPSYIEDDHPHQQTCCNNQESHRDGRRSNLSTRHNDSMTHEQLKAQFVRNMKLAAAARKRLNLKAPLTDSERY